jgi:hemerythrin superfamily protein
MANKQAQDIISLIEADHERVEQLFEDMEDATGSKAHKCFNQIYKELTLHAKAEELVFYPAMLEYEETKQYVEEAEAEHNSAKILLEQMKGFNPSDEEFKTKLTYLQETMLHHIKEEESELFDAVQSCMDEQMLQKLGEEFQATKATLEAEVEMALTQ